MNSSHELDYQKSTTSILFLDTADLLLNVGPLVLFKKIMLY